MIDVNTVYTTVLSILNKEQRGYLTPYEFNTLGRQVQLEIFESYFEDLNQMLRVPQETTEYADRVKLLREKIATFETSADVEVVVVNNLGSYELLNLKPAVHRFGMLEYTNGSNLPVEVEKVTRHDFLSYRRSPLTTPTEDYPICYIEGTIINILPAIAKVAAASGVAPKTYTLEYVKKPIDPVWHYTVGSVGQYIFDPVASGTSKDFEISDVDQTELITKILMYAGVIIRDPEIVQTAAGLSNQQDVNEKS